MGASPIARIQLQPDLRYGRSPLVQTWSDSTPYTSHPDDSRLSPKKCLH